MAKQVEIVDGTFVVAATLIGELFDIPSADVPALMRDGTITSVCETGAGADEGTFRLNLFYRTRQVRLRIDETGRILRRSVVDFGRPRTRTEHRRPICDASPVRNTAGNRKINPPACIGDKALKEAPNEPLEGTPQELRQALLQDK